MLGSFRVSFLYLKLSNSNNKLSNKEDERCVVFNGEYSTGLVAWQPKDPRNVLSETEH